MRPDHTTPTLPLDVRHLAVLREIARRGSFAAAADALCFTPSAVSHQMTKLERDVGHALFERLPRGTRMTDAGTLLLRHAETVFACLAEAEVEMRALALGQGGRLRVGSFPTATGTFMPAALDAFGERFPNVALHLVDGEPYQSAARLQARELDLALVFDFDLWPATTDYDGRSVCAQADLRSAPLFDDPFDLVMRRDHRLAQTERVSLHELAGEPIVGSPGSCPPWGADLASACRRIGVEPSFEDRYRTVDFGALQGVVAAGRGVSLMPRLALGHLRGDLAARPLDGGPVRHVRVAQRADAEATLPCAAMSEVLRMTTAHLASAVAAAVLAVA